MPGRQAAVLLLYIVIAADETPILKGLNFVDLKCGGLKKSITMRAIVLKR
jgi:hypothetical protein